MNKSVLDRMNEQLDCLLGKKPTLNEVELKAIRDKEINDAYNLAFETYVLLN
tara:strand:+ start:645 stop:800 length:156 start_codon:yes stop_codon:yes gene_type:complete